jgi:hypothetical protein
MGVMRIFLSAAVVIVGLLLAGSGHAEDAATMEEARFASWMHAGLLDPDTPIEQRRAIVDELETIAKDDSDPDVLYLLGSLYRQDPAQSSTPVEQDIDRARELLSRAALHGNVLAMAKLSTLELQAKNRFEANVWAQLYYHYASEDSHFDVSSQGKFAASILHNALEGFAKSDLDELDRRVGAILDQYDKQIREGRSKPRAPASRTPPRNPRLGNGWFPSTKKSKGRAFESGVAEYAIELGANGKVSNIWSVDAWPDPRLAKALRRQTSSFRVDADASGSLKGRVQMLPMFFIDGRYSMRK